MTGQSAAVLHVSSISYAEILLGIDMLPEGKRRRALAEQAQAMFTEDFAGRMLSFDPAAVPPTPRSPPGGGSPAIRFRPWTA
jgi:hypothetical protein